MEQSVLLAIRREFDRLCAESGADAQRNASHYADMAKAIDKEIEQAKQQLSRLHDLLEQGVYDVATFSDRRQQLLSRISTLEDERRSLVPPRVLDLEAMRERIEAVMASYPTADPDTQNHLLKSIVEKIVYHKQKGAKPKDFQLDVYLRRIYL